jgi:hypothetical protein
MLIPFVSRFGYSFFEETYQGNADLVVSAGNTASGDYTKAAHALVQSYNPFCDALQHDKGREAWLRKHTEADSKSVPLSGGLLKIGKQSAVFDAGVSNVTLGGDEADVVLTETMRSFGLLNEKQGWFGDKVVSDTEEITYDIRHGNFRVDTDRVAIFAGKSKGIWPVGQNIFETENDRAGIAVFALDNAPIAQSKHFLVYAMGRCTNTDRVWEGDTMMTHGTAPILYENVTGTLSIASVFHNAEGWLLDPVGNRISPIPVHAENNGFTAQIGGGHLYEITIA